MAKFVDIFKLRPTQYAIGLLEVEEKVDEILEMGKKDLKRFVRENPIAVIVAPNRYLYIVDGHHHTAACWMAGVPKLRIKVVHEFSGKKISNAKFWQQMKKMNWCHLYDRFGDGPRPPMYLPPDIRGLSDDPYRSLAWLVRKKGGYAHNQAPFSEFAWANFFRRRDVFACDFDLDYSVAVKKALKLCRHSSARKLPGFLG